jgi:hypothetical protein
MHQVHDGSTIMTIDLLEDYWFDFMLFRMDAQAANRNQDRLRTQRFLRAGLFSFLNYLTGLANRWQDGEESPSTSVQESASTKLADRLADLAERYQGTAPPLEDLEELSTLASRCANLKPSDEVDLFQSMSIDQVEAAELRIANWLDGFTKDSGLLGRCDTRSVGRSHASALGEIVKESYKCFDSLYDDPHAFQDPPGTWEELGPSGDPSQDKD